MNRIEEIKARCEAATPGPWGTSEKPLIPLLDMPYNAGFIAHARTDLPWAVGQIKALSAEVERLRERETYPCYDYECYERGNYHAGCSACPYFKHPLPAAPEEGAEK